MRVGDRVCWIRGDATATIVEIIPVSGERCPFIKVRLDVGGGATGQRSDFSYITEREADNGE